MNHRFMKLIVVSTCAALFAGMVSRQADTRGQANEVTFSKDDQKTTIDCNRSAVNITGDDNKIVAKGECTKLTISGDDNEITADIVTEVVISGDDNKLAVDTVTRINISGDDNKIHWKKAVGNSRPQVSDTGDDNDIKQN
jgi:uncharacterized membrane protein